eukprot:gene9294-19288_t
MDSKLKCGICLEGPIGDHVICASGHILGGCCIRDYLSHNIFPQIFELNSNSGIIRCPAENCSECFDSILLYNIIDTPSKVRYKSIIDDILHNLPEIYKENILSLRSLLLESLTLKCSSCQATVDPFPDGCSAVRCLSCGNWYCNYCFMFFSSENTAQNRAEAHTHTATHHPSNILEQRDSFLPIDIIQHGHKEYKMTKLVNQLYKALQSIPSKYRSKQDISIALILIANDIDEFDISAVWKESLARLDTPHNVTTITSENNNVNETEIAALILNITKQLALAIKSYNNIAVNQLMTTIENNPNYLQQFDPNYVDMERENEVEVEDEHPLVSLALVYNQIPLAIKLIELGANCLSKSTNGRTVLYVAIELGTVGVLQEILRKNHQLDLNARVTDEENGFEPLHVAVNYDRGDLIPILIESGADPERCDATSGHTSLALAISVCSTWAALTLLAAGVNANTPGPDHVAPIVFAVDNGISDIVIELVRNHGVDVNQEYSNTFLIDRVVTLDVIPMVAVLAALGANLNVTVSDEGYTPLTRSIFNSKIGISLELIRCGADVFRSLNDSESSRTGMFLAIEKDLGDVIRALVGAGVNINAPTSSSEDWPRPVHVAVLYKHHHLVKLLKELGADLDFPEAILGNTPLHLAIQEKDLYMVTVLLREGVNPKKCNTAGESAWLAAVKSGDSDIISVFMKDCGNGGGGFHPDEIVSPLSRQTALHVAVQENMTQAVRTLLCHGADRDIRDGEGLTPFDIGVRDGCHQSVHLLNTMKVHAPRQSIAFQSNPPPPVDAAMESIDMDLNMVIDTDGNVDEDVESETNNPSTAAATDFRKQWLIEFYRENAPEDSREPPK